VRHANSDGNTALHWASLNGHADAAALLLAAGASASALNSAQRTPVDEALQSGSEVTLQQIYNATGGGGVSEALDVDEGEEVAADTDEPLMPLD
jgi:Ankyrin repeats (many copies)